MMTSSRMTRWLTLFALAATVAVALPARANTAPSSARQQGGGENRFHVVENNGGSLEAIAKNITLVFWPCCRRTPASTPTSARGQRIDYPVTDYPAGRSA